MMGRPNTDLSPQRTADAVRAEFIWADKSEIHTGFPAFQTCPGRSSPFLRAAFIVSSANS